MCWEEDSHIVAASIHFYSWSSFISVFCVPFLDVFGYWEALLCASLTSCSWVASFFVFLAVVFGWADAIELETYRSDTSKYCTDVNALRSPAARIPITTSSPDTLNAFEIFFLLSGLLDYRCNCCIPHFAFFTAGFRFDALARLNVYSAPRSSIRPPRWVLFSFFVCFCFVSAPQCVVSPAHRVSVMHSALVIVFVRRRGTSWKDTCTKIASGYPQLSNCRIHAFRCYWTVLELYRGHTFYVSSVPHCFSWYTAVLLGRRQSYLFGPVICFKFQDGCSTLLFSGNEST